jgi:hypothetical protein
MILTALVGFLAPIVPEIIKVFQRKQENKHELEVMKLQIEAAKHQHTYKMEEITATADINEAQLIHQPMQSYGIQLLDKAEHSHMWRWVQNLMFVMYCFLDLLNMLVRPGVTYWAFFTYFLARYAAGFSFTQFDQELLILVLSYWFGQRSAKYAFGSK